MNKKAEIKETYDVRAVKIKEDTEYVKNIHTSISPVMRYFRNRKIDTALCLGGFSKNDRILDVGSNMGQYTTMLLDRGFNMVGIDLSDKAIEVANMYVRMQNLKNIEYFAADVENLSLFEDNSFDGVVSFSALRYVQDLKKALSEIYRVTKKGGSVALDFPNTHCPWFRLLKNKFGVENHIHDHFFSTKELRGLFEEAGFCEVEAKKIMFTHYTFKSIFLGLYKAIDYIGERTPGIKETAAIIVCKGVKK